jgi:hypothetical protein
MRVIKQRTYEAKLSRWGFARIGSGFYGSVWSKPQSDRVIKIGPITDAWLRFAVWAHENPGPHVVKVFSVRTHGTFYVAVIERLACTLDDFSVRVKWARAFQANERVMRNFLRRKQYSSLDPYTWAKHTIQPVNGYDAKSVSMARTVLNLCKWFKKVQSWEDYDWDLHDANVMLRREGDQWTLVITDPWCGDAEPKSIPVVRRGTVSWREAA